MASGKKSKATFFIVLLLVLVGIQFIPVNRANPEPTAPLKAKAEVIDVLRESCYDCHSNETSWPWYSYVAPVSWLVARDVHKGRERLNFSEWGSLSGSARSGLQAGMIRRVQQDEMPRQLYQAAHRDSKLSVEELGIFNRWAGAARGPGSPRIPASETAAEEAVVDPEADPGGAVESASPEAGYYYLDEEGNAVAPQDDEEGEAPEADESAS